MNNYQDNKALVRSYYEEMESADAAQLAGQWY